MVRVTGPATFVNHFHLGFTDRLRDSGSFDTPLPDLAAMKALGLNVIGLSVFISSSRAPIRDRCGSRTRRTTRKDRAAST
jgi:hypothetical protein